MHHKEFFSSYFHGVIIPQDATNSTQAAEERTQRGEKARDKNARAPYKTIFVFFFLLKIIIIALIMNLMTCIRCKSVLPGKLKILETILHSKKLLS